MRWIGSKARGAAALGNAIAFSLLLAVLWFRGDFAGIVAAATAARIGTENGRAIDALAAAVEAAPAPITHRRTFEEAADRRIAAVGAARAAEEAPAGPVARLTFAARLAAADPKVARKAVAGARLPSARARRALPAETLREFGLLFAGAGRCAEATALGRDLAERGAPSAFLEREAGRCHVEAGSVEAGIALLESALARRPQSHWTLLRLAEARLAAGDLAGAETAARRAREVATGFDDAWMPYGRILRRAGHPAEAAEAFDRAAALRPDSFWPPLLRAESRLEAGILDEAERESAALVVRDPRSYHAWHLRGRVLRARRALDEAVEAFDRALAARPSAVAPRLAKAETLFDLGRADEAERLSAAVVADAAHVPAAWVIRGRSLRALGRLDEAATALERAIAIEPEALWPRFFHAEALLDLGRTEDAERITHAIVENAPRFYYGWHLRARVLERLERFAAAAEAYGRALSIRPANVWLAGRITGLEQRAAGEGAPQSAAPELGR